MFEGMLGPAHLILAVAVLIPTGLLIRILWRFGSKREER
jgi:hypothetical protein